MSVGSGYTDRPKLCGTWPWGEMTEGECEASVGRAVWATDEFSYEWCTLGKSFIISRKY